MYQLSFQAFVGDVTDQVRAVKKMFVVVQRGRRLLVKLTLTDPDPGSNSPTCPRTK